MCTSASRKRTSWEFSRALGMHGLALCSSTNWTVAPKRGNQDDSRCVMGRIVSQLLAELDGMSEGAEGSGGVFVIGATNRPDLLEPALLQPGRFDKMLYLGVSDTHDKQLTIMEGLTRKHITAILPSPSPPLTSNRDSPSPQPSPPVAYPKSSPPPTPEPTCTPSAPTQCSM